VAAEIDSILPQLLGKEVHSLATLLIHFGEKFLAYGIAAGSKSVHHRLQLEPEMKLR
jgi:hypothetical protein